MIFFFLFIFLLIWGGVIYYFRKKVSRFFQRVQLMFKPESEYKWTILYYGPRGQSKSIHQAREILKILKYLRRLYKYYPELEAKHAIILTNQLLNEKIEQEFAGYIYYWDDADDLHYCPRKNCWKGKKRHRLHGAYVVFDDLANILPASNWLNTPMWLRKTFSQARHFGIRVLANCQDPMSIDVNFRRYIDRAYKFKKVFGTRDPDETKPPVKKPFGLYQRRKIDAEILWKYGDLPESTIKQLLQMKDEEDEQLREAGESMKIVYDDSWRGSIHWFNKKGKFLWLFPCASTETYDTLQDVQEYKPKGFLHEELYCIDPKHNHTDPKAPNFCKFKKVTHKLV